MDAKTAKENMLEWVEEMRSHWNIIQPLCHGGESGRAHAQALTFIADAVETTKWAAVYQALLIEELPRTDG